MALEQRLIQSQKLILSPQLRQYLKLLQLPLLDLRQAVEQELEVNPVLDEVPMSARNEVSLSDVTGEDPTPEKDTKTEALDFKDKIEELEKIYQDYRDTIYPQNSPSLDDVRDSADRKSYQESIIVSGETLQDYLSWQINLLEFSQSEQTIADELIGNMDEDGYIRVDVAEIAQKMASTTEDVERILEELQALDPPGVCARSLQEALTIQMGRLPDIPPLAIKIVTNHFELLEKKHFSELAKVLQTSEDHIRKAFQVIAQLEPKPGRSFYANEPIAIVPDASIYPDENKEGTYHIDIHHESVPRLKISSEYRRMLSQKTVDKETKVFLREKMTSAMNLMRALQQRKNTLRLIAEEIVKLQGEFLEKGFAYLKPLRLKDIAERIDMHESTVSRAVAEKYISTPRGTIPFRSFFSGKTETDDGSIESQKSTLEKVKKLIEAEDKHKPLSDSKIVTLLKEQNVVLARRTVAKYRDILRILPTHLRKER